MIKRVFYDIIRWFDTHRKLSLVVVLAAACVVLYPRFNRNDIAIIRPFVGLKPGEVSPDIQNYMNFADYFKHTMPLNSVSIPYSYRPLVPFLASLMPTDSLLGLIIVNIFSLLLSVISIFFILKKLEYPYGFRIAGCLLYIISFPVLYYVSSGYLDSTALLIIFLVVLATVYKKYLALPAIFLIGALVKEAIIVALPFMLLYFYQQRKAEKRYTMKFLIVGGLSVALYLASYYYARSTFGTASNYIWSPGISSIVQNIGRPKTYLSFILSFGVAGFFAALQFFSDFRKFSEGGKNSIIVFLKQYAYAPYLAGILASLLLCGYAFLAAYADGRFIWTAYPFMIPLAVKYFHQRYSTLPLRKQSW